MVLDRVAELGVLHNIFFPLDAAKPRLQFLPLNRILSNILVLEVQTSPIEKSTTDDAAWVIPEVESSSILRT